MDITINGKVSCSSCQKNYDGKLVIHLHEDIEGNLRTVPPLTENELVKEEVEIAYEYGILKESIDGSFVCPSCGKHNDVKVEVPKEVINGKTNQL